ncbi:MAG TPA: hypothetical protein VGO04_25460 [Ensifer sp.]|jgi:hypothetical protein|uniref:hypothetical protein n=1 Tax=Ensifer sp. TaxID=1872086 RepID=UPI002E162663|nr:hypothetical protein [Ensifer sp.]
MKTHLRCFLTAILAFLLSSACLRAEPLRVFVSQFTGPGGVGQSMMTTLYFELLKSFDRQGEKGVWVLYGKVPLENGTYRAAIARASLPSARADVVVWGNVTPYGQDLVVQSYLAVTPIADERSVRPELWRVERETARGRLAVELGLPSRFYDFEPFRVPANLVQKYDSPAGVPIYSEAQGGKRLGHITDAFTFSVVQENAIRVRALDGKLAGWIHLTDLYRSDLQANEFCQSLLRYMRGDWEGARAALDAFSRRSDLPSAIRIDSLILLGVTEEKQGVSGLPAFEQAFALNPFDRASAQYLILGRLSEMQRRGAGEGASAMRQSTAEFIKVSQELFPPEDAWLRSAQQFLSAE